MNICKQDFVRPETGKTPSLVQQGLESIFHKEMRHASASSATHPHGRRTGKERLVQHPVLSQISIKIHTRDGAPFQGELAVLEIRAGLLCLFDLFLKQLWKLRYFGCNGRHRQG